MSAEGAREELRRCAGTQFDPAVVAAFLGVMREREARASAVV
jgi:HD-GYP domain-containing protein (c-di-GMP phosphodiesterase class II)